MMCLSTIDYIYSPDDKTTNENLLQISTRRVMHMEPIIKCFVALQINANGSKNENSFDRI